MVVVEDAGMLTPSRQKLTPQLDATLITSTVQRKRKDAPAEVGAAVAAAVAVAAPAGSSGKKKLRAAAAEEAVVVEDAAQQQQEGPESGSGPAAPGGGLATLFSPLFNRFLGKDAGSSTALSEAAAPARPATPPMENVSTDNSTGTSASIDLEADGEVKVAAAAVALRSPSAAASSDGKPHALRVVLPPVAPQQQQYEDYDDDDDYNEFDPFLFIKRLPPGVYVCACFLNGEGGGQVAAHTVDAVPPFRTFYRPSAWCLSHQTFRPLLALPHHPLCCPPPLPSPVAVHHCVPPRTTTLLPRRTRRSPLKTLVLDLDETLVHSSLDGACRPDFTFPVDLGPVRHMVAVRKRPHLHTFLDRVAKLFEVGGRGGGHAGEWVGGWAGTAMGQHVGCWRPLLCR